MSKTETQTMSFNDISHEHQEVLINGIQKVLPSDIHSFEIKTILIKLNPICTMEFDNNYCTWFSTPYQWWNACTAIYSQIRNK